MSKESVEQVVRPVRVAGGVSTPDSQPVGTKYVVLPSGDICVTYSENYW